MYKNLCIAAILTAAAAVVQSADIVVDFSQPQPNWKSVRRTVVTPRTNGLELNINGPDSNIIGRNLDLDPRRYSKIKIIYEGSGFTAKTTGEVFFSGTNTPSFTGKKYVRLPQLIHDGKEQSVIVDMEKTQRNGQVWLEEGTVKNMRFDLVNQFPGKILLKKIIFIENQEAGKTGWDFTSPQQGWRGFRKMEASAGAEGLVLNVTGRDSGFVNMNTNIDTAKFTQIKIVYQASGFKGKTTGEIFFVGGKITDFTGKAMFKVPALIADGKEHTLILSAAQASSAQGKVWADAGKVTGLRLDLVNQFPGKIILKSVEFLPAGK